MFRVLCCLAITLISTGASADVWSGQTQISQVQSMVALSGGFVRVIIPTPITTTCGTTSMFDMAYSTGSQESRSATIGALYMSFASGKPVRFYVSHGTCGTSVPAVFTGIDVSQ